MSKPKRAKEASVLAQRGKSSIGWFFSDPGELLDFMFEDKGCLSASMFRTLFESCGLQLVSRLGRNMKNQLMPLADKLLLRQWASAETIIDQIGNILQIEHTRHHIPLNFLVNLVRGLIAYCHRPIRLSPGLDLRLALLAA